MVCNTSNDSVVIWGSDHRPMASWEGCFGKIYKIVKRKKIRHILELISQQMRCCLWLGEWNFHLSTYGKANQKETKKQKGKRK